MEKEKTWRNLSNQNVEPELIKKKSYYMNFKQCKNLRGKPVRKVAALTRNFFHGVHTFSLNFRQYLISLKNVKRALSRQNV